MQGALGSAGDLVGDIGAAQAELGGQGGERSACDPSGVKANAAQTGRPVPAPEGDPNRSPAGPAELDEQGASTLVGPDGVRVRRDDPSTWTEPVVRVPCPKGGPFIGAGTSRLLQEACDQLFAAA